MERASQDTSLSDKKREDLLMLLKRAQAEHRHIPRAFIAEAAESLDIPENQVFGVASFYAFLSVEPLGRHVIRVCRNLPCYLKHAQMIVDSVQKEIGITPGETTTDNRFSLELVSCIGACDIAPAMLVNHDVHGNLTPNRISEILKGYK